MNIDANYRKWFIQMYSNKKRGHLHLDRKISYFNLHKYKTKLVSEKKFLRRKSRLPFIKKIDIQNRYKYNDELWKRVNSKKERSLLYASHIDWICYSRVSYYLNIKYEDRLHKNWLDNNIIAYRPDINKIYKHNKSNLPNVSISKNKWTINSHIHKAKKIFEEIITLWDNTVCICLDIKWFFDNLDHQILLENRINLVWKKHFYENSHHVIYKNITSYKYINEETLKQIIDFDSSKFNTYQSYVCKKGNTNNLSSIRKHLKFITHSNNEKFWIPQWSPVSAVLSNMYMMKFDLTLTKILSSISKKVIYKRYSDDIIIIGDTYNIRAIEKEVKSLISGLKLDIQDKKTEIIHFKKTKLGFTCNNSWKNHNYLQYLWFIFDWERVLLRNSTISRYNQKLISSIYSSFSKVIKSNIGYIKKWELNKVKKIKKHLIFKKIYKYYSHLTSSIPTKWNKTKWSNKNFITYAQNCEFIMGESNTLKSKIKNQVKNHETFIKNNIDRIRDEMCSKHMWKTINWEVYMPIG